ncbi:hypothetical protein Nmel_001890, partial [Mimus melanotis]
MSPLSSILIFVLLLQSHLLLASFFIFKTIVCLPMYLKDYSENNKVSFK